MDEGNFGVKGFLRIVTLLWLQRMSKLERITERGRELKVRERERKQMLLKRSSTTPLEGRVECFASFFLQQTTTTIFSHKLKPPSLSLSPVSLLTLLFHLFVITALSKFFFFFFFFTRGETNSCPKISMYRFFFLFFLNKNKNKGLILFFYYK